MDQGQTARMDSSGRQREVTRTKVTPGTKAISQVIKAPHLPVEAGL